MQGHAGRDHEGPPELLRELGLEAGAAEGGGVDRQRHVVAQVGPPRKVAGDLDEAASIEPNNVQAWTSRGVVYEQMKDKEKAAGSYARALNIRPDYEPAKEGFKRIGGQFGQTYQAFN